MGWQPGPQLENHSVFLLLTQLLAQFEVMQIMELWMRISGQLCKWKLQPYQQ
jgi:hypothetical protein